MPRTAKAPVVRTDDDVDETEVLLDQCRKAVATSLVAIEACLTQARDVIADGVRYDKDMTSHMAWLTKQMAQIAGEISKIDSRADRQARNLSPQLVMSYLRQLEPDQRKKVIRELQAVDGEGSVLS